MESHDYAIAHFESMSRFAAALKALPAQILEHSWSGQSFGSWCVVIRHGGRISQLTYDGREGHLALRHSTDRKPPYSYGAEQSVAGNDLGSLSAAVIEEVCRAIAS